MGFVFFFFLLGLGLGFDLVNWEIDWILESQEKLSMIMMMMIL